MAQIYQTSNFIIESFEKPHVSREEGGHIRIYPKKSIVDRSKLSPELAVEFIRLTMIAGEALKEGMISRGVKIMRINYHDMGNWAFKTGDQPFFHIHIYGRAEDANFQPYKEAIQLPDRSSGFYDKFNPLDEEDILEIKNLIKELLKEDKYQLANWKLS